MIHILKPLRSSGIHFQANPQNKELIKILLRRDWKEPGYRSNLAQPQAQFLNQQELQQTTLLSLPIDLTEKIGIRVSMSERGKSNRKGFYPAGVYINKDTKEMTIVGSFLMGKTSIGNDATFNRLLILSEKDLPQDYKNYQLVIKRIEPFRES